MNTHKEGNSMKMTFDKGLATERELQVKNIYEHPLQQRLSASDEIKVTSASDVPDMSDFLNNPYFTTLEITDGEIVIPTQASYNHIADLTLNYYEESKIYNVNIVLDIQGV